MAYKFINDERYKAIAKQYVDAMERKENQLRADVRPERIKEEADEKLAKIAADLKSFYNERMAEIEADKRKIERAYKQRGKEYEDPQAEILRRQDFEAEIAVAKDEELEAIVKDTDRELTKYEINKLQLEFKNRDMTSIDMIRTRLDVKQAHETDPNYQALVTEETQMFHVKPKMKATDNWVIMPSTEEGERPKFNSLSELTKQQKDNAKLQEIKASYKELEKTISSNKAIGASYNPIVEKEAVDYADKLVETGAHKNLKKYEDNDLRAIQGSNEYSLEDEYQYLKERYADPSNKLYTFENPEYSVRMHMEYLRKQHGNEVERNPKLKEQIKDALEVEKNEVVEEQTTD